MSICAARMPFARTRQAATGASAKRVMRAMERCAKVSVAGQTMWPLE